MSSVLLIARDALEGFVVQKIFLALTLLALAGGAVFATFVRSSEERFEMLNDTSIEELRKHAPDTKMSATAMEQGLEQLHTAQQFIFFGGASIAGSAVALLLFAPLLTAPIKRAEVRGLLARPISRASYALGRFLGAAATLALFWLAMFALFLLFAWYSHTPLPPATRYAALLYFAKHLMLGSIALSLSLYTGPVVAAGIAVVANSDWISASNPLYYLLPGDDRLSAASQILYGAVVEPRDVVFALLYAFDVGAVALGFVLLKFRRMDLTG